MKNNFTYNSKIELSLNNSLNKTFQLSDIPKGYFLYPLLGKSLYDFHPELEKYWDLQKNKITLKQVAKSDGNKKWWKYESCSESFKKCIQTVVKNLKIKKKIFCTICKPRKIYIKKNK